MYILCSCAQKDSTDKMDSTESPQPLLSTHVGYGLYHCNSKAALCFSEIILHSLIPFPEVASVSPALTSQVSWIQELQEHTAERGSLKKEKDANLKEINL